uniref:Alpha-type protein kinase domain-containing protein n=2 Tax=Emiliania huxleyi TaxID=2903 RepID=A0A7S3WUB9_EMIHU
MKQFESRFTKYYKAKIYESPEPGLFGARATQIGEVDVEIADGAFESGGERNVFMMRFLRRTELFQTVPDAQGRQQQFKTFEAEASEEWVVKEDKHAKISDNNDLEFHDKSLVTQRTAAVLAEKFNELCEEKSLSVPKVKYLDAFLLVTTQPTRRQFFAERKLETTFQKWNTNNGTVVKSVRPAPPPPPPPAGADADGWSAVGGARRPGGDASWAGSAEYPAEEWELTDKVRTEHVPQAFSHWTMEGDGIDWAYMDEGTGEERAAKLLVCDIQGCYVGERYEFQLNDPVIHSQAGERCMFGLTDHGTSGIMLFMKSHICNPLCRQLGLLNNSLFEEEKTAALFRSSRKTSDLTVQKVNHLRERQLQRAIRTRELQQARKHGVQERNHDGKLRHVGPNGVVYATDESGKIGITAFRREPEEASQGPSPAPARPLVPSPPPTASPPTSSPPATSTTPPPPPALAKPSKLEALLASKLPDKVKYIRSALGMEDDPSKKMAIKSTVDEAMELVGLLLGTF